MRGALKAFERLCGAGRKSTERKTGEKTFYCDGTARAERLKYSHEGPKLGGEKVLFTLHQNGRRAPRRSDPSVPACTPSNSHPDFDAGTAVRRVRAYVSLGGDAVEHLTGDSLQYGENNKNDAYQFVTGGNTEAQADRNIVHCILVATLGTSSLLQMRMRGRETAE